VQYANGMAWRRKRRRGLIGALEWQRQGLCTTTDDETSTTSGIAAGCASGMADVLCREIPEPLTQEGSMYEAPKLERLGTLRELTLGGGDFTPGDGANPFHRYAP